MSKKFNIKEWQEKNLPKKEVNEAFFLDKSFSDSKKHEDQFQNALQDILYAWDDLAVELNDKAIKKTKVALIKWVADELKRQL